MTRHEEIAARCEAATPGPWRKDVGDKPPMPHYHIRHEGAGWPIASMGNYHPRVSNGNWKNDMEFIVNAREDIPWLLSELARLTTEVTRLAIESVEREKQLAKLEAEVQHWADAEAEGRMVVLPCEVGDTVYKADFGDGISAKKIHERIVRGFKHTVYTCYPLCDIDAFGKTVFLTKKEAERALYGPCHGCKYGDDRFDSPCSCPEPCSNHERYEAAEAALEAAGKE